MRARVEEEGAGAAVAVFGVVHPAAARREDRPAGEGARHLLHVLLRVAALDAERVQLHQLARVVLVDAAPHALLLGARRLHRRLPFFFLLLLLALHATLARLALAHAA